MIAVAPNTENVPDLYSQKPSQNGAGHPDQTEKNEQSSISINDAKLGQFLATDNSNATMAALGIADPLVTANGRASTKHDENGLHMENPCFSDSTIHSTDRKMAVDILKIIESYGVDYEKTGGSWKGLESFVPVVMEQVKKQEPIRMILPAFPFKSPNARDKVLGTMPDFGEELALSHLNGLCDSIGKVYEPGADVYISSDGLVYNDILGVPDETVWDYGETLRQMAVEKGLHHVKFIRLFELLEHPWFKSETPEAAKAYYLAHASCLRRELMFVFGDPSFDPDEAIKTDNDTCLTYRGYIKFLTKDLAHQDSTINLSKRARQAQVSQIARQMIVRGKMFAAAIKANRKDYVRLSIHESAGERKLSVSLIPQLRGSLGYTPWHASVAIGLDGSYRTVHAEDVRDTHDLVYKNGQPYYFREKSDIFNWAEDGVAVKFEHLYPSGLIIRPADIDNVNPTPSISALPMSKVRKLSNIMSPVVLRGFAETLEEDLYLKAASELGTILPWSFGVIQKVRDAGRADKLGNNVTSNEAMPMHFDGMFKFEEIDDPVTGEKKKVQRPPGYQFFTCPATAPKGSGYTLFASSRLFFRYLPLPWTSERLQGITWAMDNDGFWDAKLKNLPLTVTHPVSGLPCLRWHQPWDSTKTKFSTCDVTIENDHPSLVNIIDRVLYDPRVCLYLEWEKGDLLISDNTAMLHTRTGYKTDCDRELWRIHFD
ncbi:Pyoverdine biosynthesis [Penicillium manginii]|uniref:Pyoverdine biosynthesis n=1 Tax=Penicillium manginii TaxID=203109 RepID=UPI00254798AD|nr:Pyoverdine biosynthesis [Penicillium manginii]KAJ5754364.1 Pyoverdine biosynthesis [Penicillium manginii]